MRGGKSRDVRHQRMVMSSRMRFTAEQQIHQTDLPMIQWCSCSRFLLTFRITFGLSQEVRRRKKVVIIVYNIWLMPGYITLYCIRHLMKIKIFGHVQSVTLLNCAKICENWCKNLIELNIQIQQPDMILQNSVEVYTKNQAANWFKHFEDMSSQTQWRRWTTQGCHISRILRSSRISAPCLPLPEKKPPGISDRPNWLESWV